VTKTKTKARGTHTKASGTAGSKRAPRVSAKARKPAATSKKPATRAAAKASSSETKKANAGCSTVSLDRRDGGERRTGDRRQGNKPVAVERRKIERRAKVNRRRQIDPTTCERDYTVEEIEFMNALDEYKRTSGRMFPTCSEVLEVIQKLGYRKSPSDGSAASGA